jgi:hypothetical protein
LKTGCFSGINPRAMRSTVGFWKFLYLTILVAATPWPVLASAPAAASFHFVGMGQLVTRTNLKTLEKALTIPSADAVRKLILARTAAVFADDFNLASNATPLVAPLVGDLFAAESTGSFAPTATNWVDAVIALHLDAKRIQLWSDSLNQAFGKAGEKFDVGGYAGLQWKGGASNTFWIVPAGEWLVVGCGSGLDNVRSDFLNQVKNVGRPVAVLKDHLLEAEIDLTQFAAVLPDAAKVFRPARVQMNLAEDGNSLLTTARVVYPDAIEWNAIEARKETNFVPARFDSFTSGQNIQAFLNLDPQFARLDGSPLTNQFNMWALGGMPFLTYAAWPQSAPSNTLAKLAGEATNDFNAWLKKFNGTELTWLTNVHKLVLSNLRVFFPTIEDVTNNEGSFLALNLFSRMPVKQPASADLWRQVTGRTNLVYYDWEQTGTRLQDWRLLGRMLLFRQPHMIGDTMVDAGHVEDLWLTDLLPAWNGSTVTEVTRVSPKELSIVRNSPVGLTSIEIFLLCDWLTSLGLPP